MTAVHAQQRTAKAAQPTEKIIVLQQSAGPVESPERGFSVPVDLDGDSLAHVRDRRGATLVRIDGRLDAYRDQDLPPEYLARIELRLNAVRHAGLKALLRFMYNEGPYPNSEPDASLVRIKAHIAQLKPVLQKHADVIVWLEAGFIGAWGEWHSSTHGLDRDTAAKREVMAALLDALPAPRSVLLRYPTDIARLYGASFSAKDAGSTEKSRIGHHNDCFLASETDTGTYGRGDRSIEQEKSMIASYGKHAPIGGETCAVNTPRSSCATAVAELERLGFSELNLGYHPGVLDGWRREGCFADIQGRLGYRLWVSEVRHPASVDAGADARISITLHNSGFAAPVLDRPVYLLLEGATRRTFRIPIGPRTWAAGKAQRIEIDAALPVGMPAGKYSISLWLPDPAKGLRNDPRYAIRLANDGVWDAGTGHNRLPSELVVRRAPAPAAPPATARVPLPEAPMGLGMKPR